MAFLKPCQDEMEMNMRLIGAASIADLHPGMIDTRGVGVHSGLVPADTLGLSVYDPLSGPKEKAKL